MENKKKDEFEDLFKEKFENFEPEVRSEVWKNIQAGLKGVGIGMLGKMILNKIGTNTIIAVLSSAAAVVGTVAIINWKSSESNQSQINSVPVIVKPAKEETKQPEITTSSAKQESIKEEEQKNEKNSFVKPEQTIINHKNDRSFTAAEIEAKIAEESVASISASTVSGTNPLIVTFSNSGTGKVIKWTFADGKEETPATAPIHVFEKPGIYLVTLATLGSNGKTVMDSTTIEVKENLHASKTQEFSPNGDGKRDTLKFIQDIPFDFVIVDKSNSVVYSSKGTEIKWAGKDNNGKEVKDGLYFYLMTSQNKEGKKFENKGTIMLKR